jgi:hypothetical protein
VDATGKTMLNISYKNVGDKGWNPIFCGKYETDFKISGGE